MMRHFHVTFLCRTHDNNESFHTNQFYDQDIKTTFPTWQDFSRWEKLLVHIKGIIMSSQGDIRKLNRELYLMKRDLDKIDETIENIVKEFGKQYVKPSLIRKKEKLENKITDIESNITSYKGN